MRVEPEKTSVVVGDQPLSFHLRETTTQERKPSSSPWREFDLIFKPTGKLTLQLDAWTGGRTRWRDGKRQRLENVLGDFVEKLEAAAELERKRRVEREEHQREWQRREQERREEQKRVDQLNRWAEQWETSSQLKRFLRAARTAHQARPERYPDDLGDWLAWADEYVNRLDPL